VLRATPPSEPLLGDERTYARSSDANRGIRVLSPRIEPPVIADDGSTVYMHTHMR
jgi:hypothetical protein